MRAARINRCFPLGLALLTLLVLSRRLRGGDWHSGADVNCNECHTMHNSSAGQPMRYDANPEPAAKLLRHANPLSLCLYCHDGSKPTAPDVLAPVSYVSDPAGGSFPNVPLGTATGIAHTLGGAPVTPPGGSVPMTLTCVSCHDPHGSTSFRNLKTDPLGNESNLPVIAKQTVKANGMNPASVYVQTNVVFKSGVSAWCGSCHGEFHGRTATQEGTGSPFLRHPQNQTISSSRNADFPYWSTALANRIPVQSPTDDVVPSFDDQVMCLSCHKAHGSANSAATIFSNGASLTSTCQQCHNE